MIHESSLKQKPTKQVNFDRELTISRDDPFANIFMKTKANKDLTVEIEQFFPDFDGT